jgi:hypothetical protein
MAWETDQLLCQLDDLRNQRVGRIKAGLEQPLRADPAAIPPRHGLGKLVDLIERQPERLADVAHRTARPVGMQRGGEGGTLAAVLVVDVLHDLFAPLVLEVDVDIRRFVALPADETFEQHRHQRRIDFGDTEAITDGGIGGRAASLAENLL